MLTMLDCADPPAARLKSGVVCWSEMKLTFKINAAVRVSPDLP